MDYLQIQVRLIIASALTLLLAIPQISFAQVEAAKEILRQTYDLNDDTGKSYLKNNAVYIIVTSKNCIKCFEDICGYLRQQADTSYKHYGLIVTHKNYLNLIPLEQRYAEEISCVGSFYFYFISPDQSQEISKICDMPSPQMIIKTGDKYQYLDYKATLALVGD
jgi:hypothetical protein